MQNTTQKLMQKRFIGELNLTISSDRLTAELRCVLPNAESISVIVQDELGRSRWTGSFAMPAGKSTLQLDLPLLSNGSYNAWIEAGEETVIRSFTVEGLEASGLLGRLRQLLS